MVNEKTGRVVSQDDWKRTQIRMPQDLYSNIVDYAHINNLSLNSAMIDLMNQGLLKLENQESPPNKSEKQLQIEDVYEKLDVLLNRIESRLTPIKE